MFVVCVPQQQLEEGGKEKQTTSKHYHRPFFFNLFIL